MSQTRKIQLTIANKGFTPKLFRMLLDQRTLDEGETMPPRERTGIQVLLGAKFMIDAMREGLLEATLVFVQNAFADMPEVQDQFIESMGFTDKEEVEFAKKKLAAEREGLDAAHAVKSGDINEGFRSICRFCERVERGEVQSVRSYLEFQYALGTPWKPGCACPDHNPVRREGPGFALLCPTCKKEWERFSNFVKPD